MLVLAASQLALLGAGVGDAKAMRGAAVESFGAFGGSLDEKLLLTYLSIFLSVCLSVCIYLSIFLSFCRSICLSVCLSVCLYLSIYLSVSVYPSIYLYVIRVLG